MKTRILSQEARQEPEEPFYQQLRTGNIHRCAGCPWATDPKSPGAIGSRGPEDARIAIVGEAPGKEEIKNGVPFVGRSGKLLKQQLEQVGITLDDCFITNSLSCLPPEGDSIGRDAIRSCNKRLISELSRHPRDLVIAVGGTALKSLTEIDNAKITQSRGQMFNHPKGFRVVPTLHPAAILRNGSLLGNFREDLRYAAEVAAGKTRDPGETKYAVIEDDDEVALALRGLNYCSRIAIDIETGTVNRQSPVLCIGIAWEKNKVLIFPWDIVARHKDAFNQLFQNPKVKKIFHNGKFDTTFLVREGLKVNIDEDTMLMHYVLDETPGTHGLKELAATKLGANEWADTLKQWVGDGWGGSFQVIPREVLYPYLANDCNYTLQLWDYLEPLVKEDPQLERVYRKILIPAANFLRGVEMTGIWVSPENVNALRQDLMTKLYNLTLELKDLVRGYAGRLLAKYSQMEAWELLEDKAKEDYIPKWMYDFNPGSTSQIKFVLYKVLRLSCKPEDTKYFSKSTSKRDLEMLPDGHPFVKGLLRYRLWSKALGTYVDGILKRRFKDGRIHTLYSIHGTVTGRLASSGPNLQNITNHDTKNPDSINVRTIFAAPPGRIFIELDYSQAELRILAALSGDPVLTEIYHNERDLHDEIALRLFGPGFSKKQRRRAKTLNFGVVYGLAARNLADKFKMSIKEAEKMIQDWYNILPVAKKFLDAQSEKARKGIPIRSLHGRLRRWGLITPENVYTLMNEAKNAPMQAPASDFTLLSGIFVEPTLEEKWDARVVNIVHDSLLIEAPDDPEIVDQIVRYVSEQMLKLPKAMLPNPVPFVVDAVTGYNWGNLKGYCKVKEDGVYYEQEHSQAA